MRCVGDPALDARGHSAVDVAIVTRSGATHARRLDIPPGFPGNALADEEHRARFDDCVHYSAHPLPERPIRDFLEAANALADLPDARRIVDWLVGAPAVAAAQAGLS